MKKIFNTLLISLAIVSASFSVQAYAEDYGEMAEENFTAGSESEPDFISGSESKPDFVSGSESEPDLPDKMDSEPEKAVELLNEVRDNRNLKLFSLDSSLTPQQIQQEIYKEYRKECVGEGGQLFFYYKRRNAQQIAGTAVKPGKSVYVLPIPENDVEFGGYAN